MKVAAAVAFGAALLSQASAQRCTGPLVVDDFSRWAQRTNSLGVQASDDGTMARADRSGTNSLLFQPRQGSYLYENLPCRNYAADGFNAISFTIRPFTSGSSFVFEAQSKQNCSDPAAAYSSQFLLFQNLNNSPQTITIPFSNLNTTNLSGLSSLVFSTFTPVQSFYTLSSIRLECGAGAANAPRAADAEIVSRDAVSNEVSAPEVESFDKRQQCQNMLIDDFVSQSRLTFLYYNAMYRASSDDGTMTSVVVGNPNRWRATFTPRSTDSYWYTQFDCVDASSQYGGISLRMSAPAGTTLYIEMQSSTACSTENNLATVGLSSSQLGWTFNGREQLYTIPFSRFSGLNRRQLVAMVVSQMTRPVTMGPLAFYCGNTASEYTPPTITQPATPSGTAPVTTATASALVIDTFANRDSNNLQQWHGADDGLSVTWGRNQVTIRPTSADLSFYTQLTGTCRDIRSFDGGYLHVVYSGSNAFSIALQQHNSGCNENIAPYPETWDALEAARYTTSSGNIYIPLTHFNINRSRAIGLAFKGFYTTASTTLTRVEIVRTVPSGTRVPEKVPSGQLVFSCTRPNSFAFAIDDGSPEYAQQVLSIIREENIKVTFFTVGAPLIDTGTNLSNVYNEMKAQGHQIALHSFTHPPMEGLASNWDIDWEIDQDLRAMQTRLGIGPVSYFRPPFGTEGARMRQRLAAKLPNAKIMNWSVDVEDWLWAESDTPERQLDAFRRDVNKGGNLVVLHYLYPSTVGYLRQFIQIAKQSGKQLMRVDQCMQDPNAPPL